MRIITCRKAVMECRYSKVTEVNAVMGFGSILSGFLRSAMPTLKRGLSIFGKEALRTGAKIPTDVAD